MSDSSNKSSIGLLAALSIGVGGMIGAGIFSILGVVASIAGSAMPLSFAIGGVVAGRAAYSYVALGRTFPSVEGAVTFMVCGYGEGVLSGSLNLFQYEEAGGQAYRRRARKHAAARHRSRPEGGRVVPYAGWPLYISIADSTSGAASGQGLDTNGGLWYVLPPSGQAITKAP